MLPSEMLILMAISIDKNNGKKILTRPMDIIGEYIGYLYSSLVNRGYLKRQRVTGYRLTPLGKETILGFLHKNENRAEDIVKRLQMMGIDISLAQGQKIGKLEKESIRVK